MINILVDIYKKIIALTTEQIALLSIVVTFIIYLLGKISETKMKRYEVKKQQYAKLIEILSTMFTGSILKDKKGQVIITTELKEKFFDLGSSLAVFASNKLYKRYIFYRNYVSNPIFATSKFYDNEVILYMLAEMVNIIRNEIGLNNFNTVSSSEILSFFINDIGYDPITKVKTSKAKYKLRMLKLELFLIDRISFVYLKQVFYFFVMPIGGIAHLAKKYFFQIPLGKLIKALVPNAEEKLSTLQKELEDKQNYLKAKPKK